jgi:DNA-binding transcriptional MerR regulator
MLKISDFSRLARVPTATLRYYDDLGLLTPAHVDKFTEYRSYTLDQLPRLNRILALKDLGFSLEEVARLLKGGVPTDELRAMLTRQQADGQRELRETQARLARVALRLEELEQAGQPSPYDVVVKDVAPAPIVSTRQRVAHIDEMAHYCDELHGELRAWLDRCRIKPPGLPAPKLLNLYHSDEYTETDLDVEAAVMIASAGVVTEPMLNAAPFAVQVRELEGATVASALHQGEMAGVVPMVRALFIWIASNQYTISGPMRELHLIRPHTGTDMPLVEIQIPILVLRQIAP